jgi:hypothetical protein
MSKVFTIKITSGTPVSEENFYSNQVIKELFVNYLPPKMERCDLRTYRH